MEHLQSRGGCAGGDDGSTLHHYRAMIAFRKAHPAFAKGTLDLVEVRDDHISFVREHEGTALFCAFNLSATTQTVRAPTGTGGRTRGRRSLATETDEGLVLPPWQAWFGLAGDE
jgi:alpha-glucosidase